MKTRLLLWWDLLRSNYWFIPSLLSVASLGLAHLTIAMDHWAEEYWQEIGQNYIIYTGGPNGARSLLSTVAASMITVGGTVFSVTIVAFTLASAQYGPRLLRTFMYDTGNQVVLGVFLANFLYCLIITLEVRGNDGDAAAFVPHISMSVAIFLTLISLFVLIYFIQHVCASIQAYSIIHAVGRDLEVAIDRSFPLAKPDDPADFWPPRPDAYTEDTALIPATMAGYIQAIDTAGLLTAAAQHDVVIQVEEGPGAFVAAGTTLARVWPGDKISQPLIELIQECYIIGNERTHTQDVGFPINQLVQLCLRALSPAINDPITAGMCIERFGAAFCHLAGRRMPDGTLHDAKGRLGVILQVPTYKRLLDAAFSPIRQYGETSVGVTLKLLHTFAIIGEQARHPGFRAALWNQAQIIRRCAETQSMDDYDRESIQGKFQEVAGLLRDGEK